MTDDFETDVLGLGPATKPARTLAVLYGEGATDTAWVQRQVTFDELCATPAVELPMAFDAYHALEDEEKQRAKQPLPWMVLGTAKKDSTRKADALLTRSAIALDIERPRGSAPPPPPLRVVRNRASKLRLAAWVYSSTSHTKAVPRYRVVVPLAKPIPAGEYPDAVDQLAETLGLRSWVDYGSRTATRIMYMPAVLRGGEFESVRVRGGGFEPRPVVRDTQATAQAESGSAAALPRASWDAVATVTSLLRSLNPHETPPKAGEPNPRDGRSRQDWLAVGMVLHHHDLSPAGHMRRLWGEWSRGELWGDGKERPVNYRYESDLDVRWASFGKEVDRPVRMGTLVNLVRADQTWRRRLLSRETGPNEDEAATLGVEDMLQRYVAVAQGKLVAERQRPRVNFKFDEFQYKHRSVVVPSPTGGATMATTLWNTSPERVTVDTMTFAPEEGELCSSIDGRRALNLWRPLPHTPPPDWRERVRPWAEHLEYLVPIESERTAFTDWLAHVEQRPAALPHFHFIMVADQTGIGRNWMAEVLARVWRGYVAAGFHLSEALARGFNGELSCKLMAQVDEINEGGATAREQRNVTEQLKKLATESVRTINKKYGGQWVEPNYCRWLLFSNHLSALPLADNDRRWFVVLNPNEPRPADYYVALYALLNDEAFIAAVREWLRRRDISGFNPGARPAMNEAKRQMIDASLSDAELSIRAMVRDFPGDLVTAHHLVLEGWGLEGAPAARLVSFVAQQSGAVRLSRKVRFGPKVESVWALRNHARWEQAAPDALRAEIERGLRITHAVRTP